MPDRVWYRSLYWRIALGLHPVRGGAPRRAGVAVRLARGAREHGRELRSPAHLASIVASNLADALETDPQTDVGQSLRDEFGRSPHRMLVILRDGRVFKNRDFPEPEWLVRAALARIRRESMAVGVAPVRPDSTTDAGGRNGIDGGPRRRRPRPAAARSDCRRRQDSWRRRRGARRADRLAGPCRVSARRSPSPAACCSSSARRRWRSSSLRRHGDGCARSSRRRRRSARATRRCARPRAAATKSRRSRAASTRWPPTWRRGCASCRKSDRARRQLLADVSHELMTPLTAMRGYLETLALPEAVPDAATRERYLHIVTEETLRLESIIGDLLDLARLEGGGGELQLDERAGRRAVRARRGAARSDAARQVAVARHAHRARRRNRPTAMRGGSNRRCRTWSRTPCATRRPAAASCWPPSRAGRARHSCGSRTPGPGIPPEHLPHVFDRFYRVDAARDQATGGSGLGLSIVRAIVERHGGRVEVSSPPGRGASFELTLDPLTATPRLSRPRSHGLPQWAPAPPGRRRTRRCDASRRRTACVPTGRIDTTRPADARSGTRARPNRRSHVVASR